MSLPVLERDETLIAVADSSRRWTELIRSVRNPESTAIGHWTVRDVAVHTSHIFGLFPELISGGRSPIKDHLNIAQEWDDKVKTDPERDLDAIADRIERATKEFIDLASADVWTKEVWWHGGLKTPVYSLAGILINEAELHGLDVAAAEGRDWNVAPDRAIKAIVGLFPVLPYFVNSEVTKGMDATYELKLRGGPRVFIHVVDDNLTIETQPRSVDCHMSVDPVEYLLIGYGRKSRWGPIAKGKVLTWGRKPLLSLKFANLFHSA
jgi:uncharacterized protein (TIGR03083 family)